MVGTPPPLPPLAAGAVVAAATIGTSRSPHRACSLSRIHSREKRSSGEVVVNETMVREAGGGGSGSWSTLTNTNYTEWEILMRIKLQGAGLWEVVNTDNAPDRLERQALGAILSSVLPEMVQLLAARDNVKTMRVGDDRVREACRQKLRKDFDNLAFRSRENVKDF